MPKSKRWVLKTLISLCSFLKLSWRKRKNILLDLHLKLLGSLEPEKQNFKNILLFVLLQKQSCIPTIKNGFAVIAICPSNSINGTQVQSPVPRQDSFFFVLFF